ncbi:aquaporin Z [Myceligenerans sp. I2]|uniref:Aquaporin Z n=2 Tax=Myceligenerans indicum TaxID=2593663 RepID=A0ABS1LN84_9MICO|nr:aquaporin Z [Myceligenerans indicum]
MTARLAAEFLGTFVLVFGGVGTALFAANFPDPENNTLGVGFLGVALAFGLTVVVGSYAMGPISGGHFNPAVTLGVAAAGRFAWRDTGGYLLAQFAGGLVGSSALAAILSGTDGAFAAAHEGGFASNGYGELSPGGYGIGSAMLVETILTAVFLFVIIGATAKIAAPAMAGLAIGLTLTLIHLVSIPVTNTSVNPARSLAAAVYGGGEWLGQVWLFFVFPVLGALIAGFAYKALFGPTAAEG